ncbi:hypothetical protein DCAR_0100893 [Daucus carota subsp. sativus]|uniref:Fe2OG dioxygenase domain-containing protein n=1 Tax=Daucus carota subsp. sativus TaxID=79200 RepID=A0AAF0W1N6_DAUCS|nr:PREDICTED: hyoscyamine 6-dioxygenase-like [Daucus carota subsp. sativus]WOG81742.1 hypothetical protein DCAR_0100893 [Daucus carota subsp. sativus]
MAQSDLLVSSWCKNVKSLPADYIMPPEKRTTDFSVSKDIPVLDLGQEAGRGRSALIQQIIKAGEEFGAFQVINHGVSDDLMHEAMRVYEEFFSLPVDDHESLLSDDFYKSVRLYTSGYNYANEDHHLWKDTLKHPACAHPQDEVVQGWPDKPERYREIITKYSVEVRKMSVRILDLICEGLGLEEGFFRGELSQGIGMVINNYPPCPEPSLAMGIHAHCDPYTLTVIQQQVYGLQIKKSGKWIGVDPLPNAFVIMIPYQLQIISNGKLSSCEHRGVTNTSEARISVVTFCGPSKESVIGPAKEHVSASNPPQFKTYKYLDFQMNYLYHLSKKNLCNETALGPYLL